MGPEPAGAGPNPFPGHHPTAVANQARKGAWFPPQRAVPAAYPESAQGASRPPQERPAEPEWQPVMPEQSRAQLV